MADYSIIFIQIALWHLFFTLYLYISRDKPSIIIPIGRDYGNEV